MNARLLCEESVLVPGTTAHLGVLLEIAPEWHLFWDGCNDTGYPITVHPELPPGFRARSIEWPAPVRIVSDGDILDHVYEGRVLLILPVDVPAELSAGDDVALGARLEWVSCRDACEVGGDSVSIRMPVIAPETGAELRYGAVPVRSAATIAPSESAPLFVEARARVPRENAAGGPIRCEWKDDTLVVTAAGASSIAFYPHEGCEHFVDLVRDGTSSASSGAEASSVLELRTRAVDGRSLEAVRGVVEVHATRATVPQWIALDVPAPKGGARSNAK